MRRGNLSIAMLAFTWVGVVDAQTAYSWVDQQGVTHFSQERPPASVTRLTMKQLTPSAPAPASSIAQPDALSKSDQAAFRKQLCATARHNMEVLSGPGLVVREGAATEEDDFGGLTKLSGKERAAAKAANQKDIDEFCE
jgi:hypothetical protein